MIIPREKYFSDWGKEYRLIKPTGRYKFITKIYSNGCEELVMFIEARWGFFNLFTKWIHEDYIDFIDIPQVKEEIYKCKGKGK